MEGGVKRKCGLSAIKLFFVAALRVGDSGQGSQVRPTNLGMMLDWRLSRPVYKEIS
jgi:hypothetical protein